MRQMLRHVDECRLAIGAQLPTEAQWAERCLVSRVTVRAALHRLCEQGWIRREQGRGTFLARSLRESAAGAESAPRRAPAGRDEGSAAARELGLLLRWGHPAGEPDLYHEEVIAGVKDALDKSGLRLSTWFIEPGETPGGTARRVMSGRPAGAAAAAPAPAPAFVLSGVDVAETLDDWPAEAPLCCIGQPVCYRPISYVDIDNAHGAWLATRHLLNLGRRRIALFGDFTQRYAQNRIRGYARALQEAGVPFTPGLLVDGVKAGREEAGAEALRRLWDGGARPDAIFAVSSAAAGIWRLCAEAGARVPEDLALVGLDDFSWIMARIPQGLTMIEQPFRAAAAAAARLALAPGGAPGAMELFRPQLIVRDTCGAAVNNEQSAMSD